MKKLFLIISILILIIAGVLIFGLSKMGPLIKTAVNTYGPRITNTTVRLGDVDVSLFSAQAKIQKFYLGNPKGFRTSEAMTVGSILVDVNESSLTKETIIIDRIEVIAPQLTYEKTAKTDNFQAILNNVRKGNRPSKPEGAKKKQASGKKIVIKDFKLTKGKVNLAASLLGQNQSISTDLPDIHLTNIGEKKGGLKAGEAFQVILDELQKRINSPDVMNSINQQLKALNINPQALEKEVQEKVSEAEDTLTKEAEEALNKEAEGALNDLLGK